MYGNLNKHKVLSAMLKVVNAHNADFSIKMNYEQLLPTTNLNYKSFEKAIFSLALEKYVSFIYHNGHKEEIGLFHIGANAALTDYFKEKHERIIWTIIKDGLLVLCSLIVAVATVYALTKDTMASQKTIDALSKVQAQQAITQSKLSQMQKELDKYTYQLNHPKKALSDSSKN